jgi:hypothetical protein
MFPSDHAYPNELPDWLLDGHAFDAVGVTDDAAMDQGEDLMRQVYTWVPKIANVSTTITQAHFDRFFGFYEDELLAGTRRFDTKVAAEGGRGPEWWVAQYIAPPQWEAREGGWLYTVRAQLLLLDGPYSLRLAPSLRARLGVVTQLEARLDAEVVLRAQMAVVTSMSGFLGDVPLRITEDGTDRITEDGAARSLES